MVIGITKLFTGKSNVQDEISKVVPISDCNVDCADCETKYPSTVSIDDSDMYNSMAPFKLHLIIPTGKCDWKSKALGTPGTYENLVSKWSSEAEKIVDGNVKVSVSDFDINDNYEEDVENDILILPYFVWVRKLHKDKIGPVLSKVITQLSQAQEFSKEVNGCVVEPSNFRSYVFLCSHKTKDKRCGITAPIIKKEFECHLREEDLLRDFGDDRPGGVKIGFVNHVGGHKFVANVIIYLKTGEMIWLAKVTPPNVKPILYETILGGGKVWPEKVRLVQKHCAITW